MSIWNKILLGCIFVAALTLFIFSARALQAHRVWRESYNKHKEAIATAEQQVNDLIGNLDAESTGLLRAKLDLYEILLGRGRVWRNCQPTSVEKGQDPATKQERVLVTVQTQPPVESDSVLYAFEDKPASEGGAYLGQFTVIEAQGEQAKLRPSVRLSTSELARVQASQQANTPWSLYELMPTDDPDVLAELTDEDIKAMFPNEETFQDDPEGKYSTYKDYQFHGKIITKEKAETEGLNGRVVLVDEADKPLRNEEGLYTDVEDAQAKGMFLRNLRDYEVLFDEEHRLRALLIDRIRVADRDLKFIQQALDDSRLQRQARQKEIQDLEQEKAKVLRERDAVVEHQAKLDRAIASMKKAIEELIARNEAAVAQVGRIQADASRVIRNRTTGVAKK